MMAELSELHEHDGVYRTSHDMNKNGLSITIIQALAEIEDEDPIEVIENYSDYVDPDALDHLFRIGPSGEHRHSGGYVHLEIKGYSIIVRADGTITLEP